MAKGDVGSYEVISPEDIRADKMNLEYLILQQLNRINFLLTVGVSNTGERKPSGSVNSAVIYGLRSVESLLQNHLKDDQEYSEQAGEIKSSLNYTMDCVNDVDGPLAKWYDLLIRKLPYTMVSAKKKTFDFEE
jgi:hypothetical protein